MNTYSRTSVWSRINGSRRVAQVVVLGLLTAGCEPGPKAITLEQKIARQVNPVRKRLAEQDQAAQAAQRATQEELLALREGLSAKQGQVAALTERLEMAEAALVGYEKMNIPALREAVEAQQRDLRRLEGEHTGHVYRTATQFENNDLIHANLEQSDADLRKHIANSVASLERRSKQARDAQRSELVTRFEEDRSVVLSGFRDLEGQVGTGSSRAALAVQLIREFLATERLAMAGRAQRLEELIEEIDQQFSADEAQARDQTATQLFDKARQLHQVYLADHYRTEELAGAIVAYQEGLALRPDATDMHYELGKLLHTAGREDDAQPHLLYYLKNGQDPQRQEEVRAWLGEQ